MKVMSRSEAETKRRRAVEFLRRIRKDDLADQFESMDAEGYAAHKGAQLIDNPVNRRREMPDGKTKAKLESELDEANDYIEELETKLDQIAGIATDEEEDSDTDFDSADDDEEGEEGK